MTQTMPKNLYYSKPTSKYNTASIGKRYVLDNVPINQLIKMHNTRTHTYFENFIAPLLNGRQGLHNLQYQTPSERHTTQG